MHISRSREHKLHLLLLDFLSMQAHTKYI